MPDLTSGKLVVDSVHGDIRPTKTEWRVIDTATFQRLRRLKQLQMGYLVYPNAVHTRFSHSIGVLRVMERVLEHVNLKPSEKADLRLAALLHDIGHYPYSHLLEKVHKVELAEHRFGSDTEQIDLSSSGISPYPKHEEVGRMILENQEDLRKAIGTKTNSRLKRIASMFTRDKMANPHTTRLIHSSLDMDRMDYLIRDSRASGVPYGQIDLNYLLNNIRQGNSGIVGISSKALAAAEHLLLARSFLFRVVCQHKTIYGIEEMARQLLKRLQDRYKIGGETYDVPRDEKAIRNIVKSDKLSTFTDSFLDEIFTRVVADGESDEVVFLLAQSIVNRRPPALLFEKREFLLAANKGAKELFYEKARRLKELADNKGLHLGRFLVCCLPEIGFESHGYRMTQSEAEAMAKEGEFSEMIQVFEKQEDIEPKDVVDIEHSILHQIGNYVHRGYRIYFVTSEKDQVGLIEELRQKINSWWQEN